MIQDTSVTLSKVAVTLDRIHNLLREMHYGRDEDGGEARQDIDVP